MTSLYANTQMQIGMPHIFPSLHTSPLNGAGVKCYVEESFICINDDSERCSGHTLQIRDESKRGKGCLVHTVTDLHKQTTFLCYCAFRHLLNVHVGQQLAKCEHLWVNVGGKC